MVIHKIIHCDTHSITLQNTKCCTMMHEILHCTVVHTTTLPYTTNCTVTQSTALGETKYYTLLPGGGGIWYVQNLGARTTLLLQQIYPEKVGFYPLPKCPLRRANPWAQDLCKHPSILP